MNSQQIKNLFFSLGADVCGIASVERFNDAPKGFHPKDIYAETKSVIAFGKQVPSGVMYSKSPVPFTNAEDVSMYEVWRIGLNAAVALENEKMTVISIPSEPYEYWDKETMTGKGILSLKHAGYLAGLGVFGYNSLLYTPRFGCMVKFGAFLVAEKIDQDAMLNFNMNCQECMLCATSCPSGAIIQKETVMQKPCREHAYFTNEKGYHLMVCNTCRKVCPNRLGFSID